LRHLTFEYLVEQILGIQVLIVGFLTEKLQDFRVEVHGKSLDDVLSARRMMT